MLSISSLEQWRGIRANFPQKQSLGFVPTMGALHAGHQSLLEQSLQENDITVLSIFVNPTQFDQAADFTHYPQSIAEDLAMAQAWGVDYVLLPKPQDIYPDQFTYQVHETQQSQLMEGGARPGHFSGVLTVVLKLLLLVQPTRAYFGEKDYQQYQLIQGMVEAFFLNVNIIPCSTVRDPQGLALSSRNRRLTPSAYELAQHFPALLASELSCDDIIRKLQALGIQVDYIQEHQGRRFGAIKIGDVRLIDNVPL